MVVGRRRHLQLNANSLTRKRISQRERESRDLLYRYIYREGAAAVYHYPNISNCSLASFSLSLLFRRHRHCHEKKRAAPFPQL